MTSFDIPVVLFLFKREDKTVEIVKRLSEVMPRKLYLIADGHRNDAEKIEVERCREVVEKAITWNCEVVKNYANENKGVYDRIGLGAKWVLEREEAAIFLEDDNLPEISFFAFCKEMISRYKDDSRVLWVCGTNYLEKYTPGDGSSYVFSKHMLPCGWASWASKFAKFYDGDMSLWQNTFVRKRVQEDIEYRPLARQLMQIWGTVDYQIKTFGKPSSWDGQMSFTQRTQNLFAIVPKNNLIKNIGVDAYSSHGGTSFSNVMTRRFCGIESYPLDFPLVHPVGFFTDPIFEKKTAKIITLPVTYRIKGFIVFMLKRLLHKDINKSFWKKKN